MNDTKIITPATVAQQANEIARREKAQANKDNMEIVKAVKVTPRDISHNIKPKR